MMNTVRAIPSIVEGQRKRTLLSNASSVAGMQLAEAEESFESRTPEPLSMTPPPPLFPLDALPDRCRQDIENLSSYLELPVECVAMATLGSVSVAASRVYKIRLDEAYSPGLNLYVGLGLYSADGKSPLFSSRAKPFYDFEKFKRSEGIKENQEIQASREDLESRIREGRRAGEDVSALVSEKASLVDKPIPRYLVSDCTPQRMAGIASEQGGFVGSIDPEGTVIKTTYTYSKNGAANPDTMNRGYDEDPITVDRNDREAPPINVPRPCFSLVFASQPHVLQEWVSRKDLLESGTLPRCQIILGETNVGYRKFSTSRAMSLQKSYELMITEILHRQADSRFELTLSDPAEARFRSLRSQVHEPKMRPEEELGHLRFWAGKICGTSLRIAGLLHVLDAHEGGFRPEKQFVTEATMNRAIRLYEFLCLSAVRFYAFCGIVPGVGSRDRLSKLLENIRDLAMKGDGETFSEQALWQIKKRKTGHYSKGIKSLRGDLSGLIDRGWIDFVADSKPAKYKIHPSLLEYFPECTPNTPKGVQTPMVKPFNLGVGRTPSLPQVPLKDEEIREAIDAAGGVPI